MVQSFITVVMRIGLDNALAYRSLGIIFFRIYLFFPLIQEEARLP